MRTAPGIPKWDNSARDVSAQPSPQKLLSHWPIRELGRGRGSGAGGGRRRGEWEGWGVRGEARGLVCGAARAPPGLSVPAPAAAARPSGDARTHSAPPAHPRSPAHTHAHTQPGGAGATDRSASAGTSRGAVGTNTPHSSQSGLSSWRRRRGGEGGLGHGPGAGHWSDRLAGRAASRDGRGPPQRVE